MTVPAFAEDEPSPEPAVVTPPPVRDRNAVLRVSSASPAQSLASAISYALYDNQKVTLRAIGAGAVNQSMKGCAIARGYVAQRGLDLVVRPGFTQVEGEFGDEVSAMLFIVKVE